MMPNLHQLADALCCDNPGCICHRSGAQRLVHCPAHPDGSPSLSITQKDGKLLLYCFADCTQEQVLEELKARELWPEVRKGAQTPLRTDQPSPAANLA